MVQGCLPTPVLPLGVVAFAFAFYALRCQTDVFCAAGCAVGSAAICGAPYAALPDAIAARFPQLFALPASGVTMQEMHRWRMQVGMHHLIHFFRFTENLRMAAIVLRKWLRI